MKRKIFILIIIALMFFPAISVNAGSVCYKKCVYPKRPTDECSYTTNCTAGGSISCEEVEDDKCGLGTPKVSCGNVTGIPKKIPELVSFMITVIYVAIPIVLVIMGSIDLFKGITAGKDDEIKKSQQIFIKRLILAGIIFFVVVIVKFLISVIASTNKTNIIECIDCFISGDCEKYNEPNKKVNSSNKTNKTENKNSISSKPNSNSSSTSTNKNNTNSSSSSTNKNNTNSSSSSSSSKESTSTSSNKISSNLFVGDSRTVGMCGTYKLCEKSSYIAEVGKGYDWFANTAISQINNKIKSKNYNIIILMGVNGVSKTGKSEAQKYYNKISSLVSNTWKKQNVIFVSINPVVDGMSYAYTSGVNEFNSEIKKLIKNAKKSNLSYCETNSKLKMSEIDSGDGLHYNKTGYQKIYNIIKKDCLKQK